MLTGSPLGHSDSSGTSASHPSTRGVPLPRAEETPDISALFARRCELEDGSERDAARDELMTAWLPMAYRIAGRYRDRGETMEDLRQVAALGLLNAITRFDPTRGAFASYAVPTITGEIKRHFRDRMWAVRVPRRVQELRTIVRSARRELTQVPGRCDPSVADLAAHSGLTVEDVTKGMEAMESFSALSLDAELEAGDGLSIAGCLGADGPSYDVVIDREAAKKGLKKLPERERQILYMRYFQDMTQSRIAAELGLSQMYVSRLISRSCSRVRREVMKQCSIDSSDA
ncbi:SigB/SigF/SigG family RNA polymerase sigma factor [Streptomyces sp. NPDC048489]|uniref:SigB/SigF/SigG family RNA polymerase sigma factor n=1 Tax=Streptomyces sp. NPDC048489 TaxID=3154504 RepID=UPI00344A5A1F